MKNVDTQRKHDAFILDIIDILMQYKLVSYIIDNTEIEPFPL